VGCAAVPACLLGHACAHSGAAQAFTQQPRSRSHTHTHPTPQPRSLRAAITSTKLAVKQATEAAFAQQVRGGRCWACALRSPAQHPRPCPPPPPDSPNCLRQHHNARSARSCCRRQRCLRCSARRATTRRCVGRCGSLRLAGCRAAACAGGPAVLPAAQCLGCGAPLACCSKPAWPAPTPRTPTLPPPHPPPGRAGRAGHHRQPAPHARGPGAAAGAHGGQPVGHR